MAIIMGLDLIPEKLHRKYRIEEREHACAILATDFSEQFRDILDCLDKFNLNKSYIVAKGKNLSPVSIVIDGFLSRYRRPKKLKEGTNYPDPIGPVDGRGWTTKKFDIHIDLDGIPVPIPTHKIDNFKKLEGQHGGVGVEVEWNNKDPFYDRDLNNFRLLRQLGVLSVGIIITRLTELQKLFNDLGKGKSYGNSTTHWDKLMPRVDGGGAGGCPLLLIGMGMACYDPDS
jgi:hypothetical protein